MSLERSWGRSPREAAPVVRNQTRSAILLQGTTLLRSRGKIAVGAAAAVIGIVGSSLVSGGSQAPAVAPRSRPAETSPPSPAAIAPVGVSDRANYYLSVPEVDGLPDEITPWSRIELWVAWDPPITDEPSIHRLLNDAYIEAVLAPVAPDAPSTLKLSIRHRDIADLIYADRYGSLSAIVVGDS
jgi:hypothetical protein